LEKLKVALIKNITLPSGHICSYWKIIAINKDFVSNTGYIKLAGYLDAEAREDNKPSLADSTKVFHNYVAHGSTADAYDYLRTQTFPGSSMPIPNFEYNPMEPVSETNQPYTYSDPVTVEGEFFGAVDA